MSGSGRGRRLGAPGERTVVVRVGMPESLVQRIDQAVAESIPKIDRSKWIVAQILASLPPPEDGEKTSPP